MIVDLRSDTVTKPSKGMMEAMFSAPLGDDVFAEDPTVNQLQEKCAEMFGMDSALFCPSGTMTNQLAVNCHTVPMEEILVHRLSHIYNYENGGFAFHSGCSIRLLEGERGIIDPADVLANINPEFDWLPRTSLLCLENTVNKGGGSIYSLEQMSSLSNTAKEAGIPIHLDGARLFNALVETGNTTQEIGSIFDSISICLSKGLGAPVGSLLIGNKDFIKQARRKRKAFGGGMRQAGILAAAGIYALDKNVNRLTDDHVKAKEINTVLKKLPMVTNDLNPDTNIIMVEIDGSYGAERFMNELECHSIRTVPFGANWVRMVTHLDIGEKEMDHCLTVLSNLGS